MSIGSAIGSSIGRAIGSALAGGGSAFSVLSLSPYAWWKPGDFTTAFQDSAGSTPITAAGQTVGRLNDKSGNGKNATQATAANEPLLTSNLGIRQADTTDLISATLTTGGTAYINTPVGWYRSTAPATTYRLPLCDATETVVTPTLTGAQETALATYFGTAEKYMACVSTATTIANLRIYTGGGTTALLFVGANGATVTKNLSLNSNTSYDVSADGLTAPVAVAWPSSLITSTALTHFYCSTNQLTGSIPSLSANTALTQFYCNSNQLTGSIPSLSANTALTQFICNSNQLTGSIPSLSANTALQFFYCYSNQLTGSIPSLSANTALTTFQCYSNQLTGSIPSLSANTALTTFQCNTNQLTGYTGGGVSITLGDFQAQNNLLTQAAVDAILADFVAANKTTGTRTLNLGGTGNATPSATGLADKATLVSRGWTVTTN